MIKSEIRPKDYPDKSPDRDEFPGLLSAISELLGEMADSEVEAAYRIPCAPCSPLEEGLAVLLNRLRLGLIVHTSRYFMEEVSAARPSFGENTTPAYSDPAGLCAALDHIVELSLSSDWPSIRWQEIEVRFADFARRVKDHIAISGDIQR